MVGKLRIVLVAVVAAVWSLVLVGGSHGAQIELATDAPKPLAPEESLRQFQVWPDFRIELVASEPQVADPVAIAFDARGRIFVCEIHGYNLEGYLDIVELNKRGVLDKAVRRIPAGEQALQQAAQDQYGTVKLLEDTDGDGRVDRSTVWADRLPPCYGVVSAREGVIVLCAPDIVYLADRDGDGKAEVRETLFTGFGASEMWARINNPRFSVDNWIYAAHGKDSGGTIRGPALGREVQLGTTTFRFKPDGSALEPCSGRSVGFGLALTDWGERFLINNSNHALYVAPLPYRYLVRNPYYAAPATVVNASDYWRVYPASRPHPWRLARSKDPAWVEFYGAREAQAHQGYFTSACGQTIYGGGAFPAEYQGNHFAVDSALNLVHRSVLVRQGVVYAARRAAGEETAEFLTSTESWFRPVNLTVGPDGALYIVDMYRAIIEDYSAIPRFLQQLYAESLVAGARRGRIWRVVWQGAAQPRPFDLAEASPAELVQELSNPNAWRRHTAQRLLVERGEKIVVRALVLLVEKGNLPQGRLHALYTLDGLGALEPEVVEHALDDPHYAVRAHALRLAERWLDIRPLLTEKVLGMTEDPDAWVRLQVALTLGQSKDPRALDALAQLAVAYGDDRWIQAALLSSLADSASRLFEAILKPAGAASPGRSLLGPLASIVGARHNEEEIGNLLATIAEAGGEDPGRIQVACLAGLIEGLQRSKPPRLASAAGQQGLRHLLASSSGQVRELALRVAGLVRLAQTPQMKAWYTQAAQTALDQGQPIPDRQLAVRLLGSAPYSTVAPVVEQLLNARQPLDLQLAAVAALSSVDDPRVGSLLLANWPSYTPKVHDAVLDAIFSRQDRLPKLLDAIEAEVVQPSALDPVRREQLIRNSDAEVRRRAQSLLAGQAAATSRDEVLARYRAALSLPRDLSRGRQVYLDQCAKCHKLQGQGFAVGADLAAASTRADQTLISDILDPSSQITVGYQNYTVVTDDGRIFTGVLAAETATSITLRKEEGVEQTILRRQIDQMEASSISMMPEGLEKEVSPQDVADLLGYLREALGPVLPPGITLFDDEQSFADVLTEGAGTVRLHAESPFSGKAALAVTPPQRWNLRIPGWEYPIVENPGAGQFRYLRFAWKSPGGHGVMIELADDGQWPPAEKPLRRYYSGKNTTGWQAVEVSPQVPGEWVLVTRDLWRDFGSFTLTGIAPTAMGGEAFFDRIELLRSLDTALPGE